MKIISFNFTKIGVEKFKNRPEKLKTDTNLDITNITPVENSVINTEGQLIQVLFSYKVKYEPGYAELELKGNMLLSLDAGMSKEVLKEWKKKSMPENFQIALYNVILKKATVKSLQLEDELNLPLHLPIPQVRPNPLKK